MVFSNSPYPSNPVSLDLVPGHTGKLAALEAMAEEAVAERDDQTKDDPRPSLTLAE